MCWKNTTTEYGCVTKSLHGICALLVMALIIVGFSAGYIDDKPTKGMVYNIHKVTGVITLFVAALFVFWSLFSRKPGYDASMARWEKLLARFVHFLLFALILVMPLSGWIMSSAAERFPHVMGIQLMMPGIPASKAIAGFFKETHELLAWVIAAAVILHIVGALKHHFIDKNDILRRMVGRRRG